MRIVNIDTKPFEFTFDGKVFGPLPPGQTKDYPYEIAIHAIKRSAITDDIGNTVGFRVKMLSEVKQDPELFESILTYTCPLVETEECGAAPFKNIDELRTHLEEKHFGTSKSGGHSSTSTIKPKSQ